MCHGRSPGLSWGSARPAKNFVVATSKDMDGRPAPIGANVLGSGKGRARGPVRAGAAPPSTTTLLATRKVVDGRPAPAMTRIATVALLADCSVRIKTPYYKERHTSYS